MLNPGDVVVLEFPGVQGMKRCPAAILSSELYHANRPDVIIGLITSQTPAAVGPTDYALLDWAAAGLRLPSAFRAFVVTVPRPPDSARIGTLSNVDWQEVQTRVRAAIAACHNPQP